MIWPNGAMEYITYIVVKIWVTRYSKPCAKKKLLLTEKAQWDVAQKPNTHHPLVRWPRSTTPPVSLAALLWHMEALLLHSGATLTQRHYFDMAPPVSLAMLLLHRGTTLQRRRYSDMAPPVSLEALLWHFSSENISKSFFLHAVSGVTYSRTR